MIRKKVIQIPKIGLRKIKKTPLVLKPVAK